MLSRRTLLGLAAALSTSGCYGKFSLTRKLYSWNGSFGDKFLSTVLMWVLMIVPVYAVASFVDLFIFNLIEFWTGANPMVSIDHEDGSRTKFARLGPDAVQVTRTVGGIELPSFELVLNGDRSVLLRSAEGEVLASGEALADGGLALASRLGLKLVTSEQVRQVDRAPNHALAVAEVLGQGALASR